MKEKIILIDSNNIAYRAFFALPDTIATTSGIVTNAVLGFTNMLLKMIEDLKPDVIICAFDSKTPTFRHKLFDEYKLDETILPIEELFLDLSRSYVQMVRDKSSIGSKEEKEIVPAIKDLFKGINLKKSKVVSTINCSKTATKVSKAPYMPKAELHDGIALEAKNYFPFPIDDLLVDYEILGDIVEGGVRKYEVAIAVSPKATVKSFLSLLEKAGIVPQRRAETLTLDEWAQLWQVFTRAGGSAC